MFILLVCLFIGFSSVSASQREYYPNLPMGEYRIIYEAFRGCPNANNHKIKFNLHFSKKSRNTTELVGSVISDELVDDSLIMDVKLRSWSLMGGWAENLTFLRLDKFCTSLKNIAGKTWSPILNAFHYPTKNCPLPKGTYNTTGLDIRIVEDYNLPKIYFYGKYMLTVNCKYKNNTLLGCASMEFKLVRPWEVPKN